MIQHHIYASARCPCPRCRGANPREVDCSPNGTRDPTHVPNHQPSDLYVAMGIVRDVLAELEMDIDDANVSIQACNSPRQLRGIAKLTRKWRHAHWQLWLFFDINVYLDRPNNTEVSQ